MIILLLSEEELTDIAEARDSDDIDERARRKLLVVSMILGTQCLIEKDTERGETGVAGESRCLIKEDTVADGATTDEKKPRRLHPRDA